MGEDDLSAVASDLSATRDLRMRQIESEMANARDNIAVQREQIAVARGRAAADAWYQKATIKVNQMELSLKAELGRRELSLKEELGRREAALGESKAYSEFASTPDNYFKLLDMASGYGGRLPQPDFLRRMAAGEQQVLFTQPGGVPIPQGQLRSMWGPLPGQSLQDEQEDWRQTIWNQNQEREQQFASGEKGGTSNDDGKIESAYGPLPGTTPPAPYDKPVTVNQAPAPWNVPYNYLGVPFSGYQQADLNALALGGDIFARGFSKLGPQAWESLPKTAQALTMGIGRRLGYDPSLALWQYGQSRVGQGDPRQA